MRNWIGLALILAWSLGISGCASSHPPSRLDQYIDESTTAPLPGERPIRTLLVLVNDQSGPDPAPALPNEIRVRIAEQLKDDINRGFPILVEKTIPVSDLASGAGMAGLIAFGKEHGARYLLVAILSSEEQEYPVTLFLGYTTHKQPGFRRDNWSLVEAALLDVESGQLVLQAEGRAWATLDRPTAPGINQWYPAIFLRPQMERRIWPPTYEGAPITLRLVSMRQAAKRLALNMQQAWNDKRQTEIASAQP